jgi:hypothetical protein
MVASLRIAASKTARKSPGRPPLLPGGAMAQGDGGPSYDITPVFFHLAMRDMWYWKYRKLKKKVITPLSLSPMGSTVL